MIDNFPDITSLTEGRVRNGLPASLHISIILYNSRLGAFGQQIIASSYLLINSDKIDKLVSELEKTNKLISTKFNKLEKDSMLRIEAIEKNLVKMSENIEVKISEEFDKINQIILQDDLAKDELRFRIEHLVEFVKLGPIVMEIIDCSEDELRSGAYINRIYKNNQKKNKINLLFEGIQNYTGDPIPAYEKLA